MTAVRTKRKDHTISDEVAKRILAHASLGTQMNMSSAASAGLLGESQMVAFQQSFAWISATRQRGKELAIDGIKDFTDDKHWPTPTAEAKTLEELF